MDIRKEHITIKRHEVIVDIGQTGHVVKLLIKVGPNREISARITAHTFPDDRECEYVTINFVTEADIALAIEKAIIEHFEKYHPEHRKPDLKVVKK